MQTKTHFGIGLFVGILVTALFFHFFAPRYEVKRSDDKLIKQDRWSGNSWKYVGNKWEKITDVEREWKPIDDALMAALNLPGTDGSSNSDKQMAALKQKYSVLENLDDEEILERIKYIYARKIMVDMYFSQVKME